MIDITDKRVVIAGDLVADQFLNGTIARVSREAPVFILRHDETETRPGAAANAAANVASLGGQAILVGVVGDDHEGNLLMKSLGPAIDAGGILAVPGIRTTTKVRVLAGQHYAARQQVIRIDYENARSLDETSRSTLLERFTTAAESADAILLSDYGYGVVDQKLFSAARQIAERKGIPLIVDSRTRLGELVGASSATPNQEEVEQIIGKDFTEDDCEALRERLGLKALLVTRGNKGMLLVESGQPAITIDAVGSSEPVDVTGAGDTVIAAYSLGLAAGMSFLEAAEIANHAGGIVVMKMGTATASFDELLRSIAEHGTQRMAHASPTGD